MSRTDRYQQKDPVRNGHGKADREIAPNDHYRSDHIL